MLRPFWLMQTWTLPRLQAADARGYISKIEWEESRRLFAALSDESRAAYAQLASVGIGGLDALTGPPPVAEHPRAARPATCVVEGRQSPPPLNGVTAICSADSDTPVSQLQLADSIRARSVEGLMDDWMKRASVFAKPLPFDPPCVSGWVGGGCVSWRQKLDCETNAAVQHGVDAE